MPRLRRHRDCLGRTEKADVNHQQPLVTQPLRHSLNLLFGLFACLVSWQSPNAAELERVALVIGNSAYPGAPLQKPHNDAKDLTAALRALGFVVKLQLDSTQIDLRDAVQTFAERIRQTKAKLVAMVYFAGHGIQISGENYLVPTDADLDQPNSSELISLSWIANQLSEAELKLIVLDACRELGRTRGLKRTIGTTSPPGLAAPNSPALSDRAMNNLLIAYATSPGRVAYDSIDGRNSPYSAELLQALRRPCLELHELFAEVSAAVKQATARHSPQIQTPWFHASAIDEPFYFVPCGSVSSLSAKIWIAGHLLPWLPEPLRRDDPATYATLTIIGLLLLYLIGLVTAWLLSLLRAWLGSGQ